MYKNFVLILLLTAYYISPSNAGETRLDDEYVDLIKNSDFRAAFEHVSTGNDAESILFKGYHLMFGSGVEKDECAAVLIFEELANHDSMYGRAETALNIIYGRGWAAIASREGSAIAALALGQYYKSILRNSSLEHILQHDTYADEKAFINFSLAEKLGIEDAKQYLEEIEIDPERRSILQNQIPEKFESIVCPIRKHG